MSNSLLTTRWLTQRDTAIQRDMAFQRAMDDLAAGLAARDRAFWDALPDDVRAMLRLVDAHVSPAWISQTGKVCVSLKHRFFLIAPDAPIEIWRERLGRLLDDTTALGEMQTCDPPSYYVRRA